MVSPLLFVGAAEQIAEREDNSENHNEQQEQPNRVPALQHKIAAAFFPLLKPSTFLSREPWPIR